MKHKTAKDEYVKTHAECLEQIQILHDKLIKHKIEFSDSDRLSYCYVGDLRHVYAELTDINAFLK